MKKWTAKHEAQLKAGRKKGYHPATSQRKNILLCAFGDCANVA